MVNVVVGYLGRRKLLVVAFACFLVAVLWFADTVSRAEIAFSTFYLLPVLLVTWLVDRRTGILLAGIGSNAMLLADYTTGSPSLNPLVPFANAVIRFALFVVFVGLLTALKSALEQQKQLARTDCLTGAANARHFFEAATLEMDKARRYGRPFTVVYADLDNFKEINDRFGHQTGDVVLRMVIDTFKNNIRATDLVARIGGDELAILAPETGVQEVRAYVSRVQKTVKGVMEKNEWPVTFSMGAATFLSPPDSLDQLMELVDNLMYAAKDSGKNTVRYAVFGDKPTVADGAPEAPETNHVPAAKRS